MVNKLKFCVCVLVRVSVNEKAYDNICHKPATTSSLAEQADYFCIIHEIMLFAVLT